MTETTTNGRPKRKQLSEQLDRLDGIIDVLADGLNKAVADAAREGTRLAVKDAILEILTNPELRALIAPQVSASPPATAPECMTPSAPDASQPRPGGWRAKLGATTAALGGAVEKAAGAVSSRCRILWGSLAAMASVAAEVVPIHRVLPLALGVAAVVGMSALISPHALTAAVGAVGVAVVAVAAQIGSRLRRSARWLGLA